MVYDAVLEYASTVPLTHLSSIVDESELLDRVLINSRAYKNEIEQFGLKAFLKPKGRDHLIDDQWQEFDYSKYVDTTLRWDNSGNISYDTAGILLGRVANTLWTALDLVWKEGLEDPNLLLAVDAQGDTIALSQDANILQQASSEQITFNIRQNQIFIQSDKGEEGFGIVTKSGLLVVDAKIVLLLMD